MAELNFIIKFENLTPAMQNSLGKQIIEDLKLAQIKAIPDTDKKSKTDLPVLIVSQTGPDIVATFIKPNHNPIKYPLTPGRSYSDSLLGIVREAYGLDKHEKVVREILQEFQMRRIGLWDKE